MALRSTRCTQQASYEEEEEEEEDGGEDRRKPRVKEAEHIYQAKGVRHVKFKVADTPEIPASTAQECGSDSAEEVSDSFLTRREQNIKANKAMVNR